MPEMFLPAWLYAAAFAVILAAAAAQTSLGVGFGVIAAPILALLDPRLVPAPLIALGLIATLLTLSRDWRDVRLGHLGWAIAARLPASVAGAWTASLLSPRGFLLLFAALIGAGVALSLAGWRVEASRRSLTLAGIASGYMGTITSVGSPPMALVYQSAPGPAARAALSAYFAFGASTSLVFLALFGQVRAGDVLLGLTLLPALLLGFWLSGPLKRRTDRGWMRPMMLVLCLAAAATLAARGLTMEPAMEIGRNE